MFTIEEDSGTSTGTHRRHNGYYAGSFTRKPVSTDRELAALAKLWPAGAQTSSPRFLLR